MCDEKKAESDKQAHESMMWRVDRLERRIARLETGKDEALDCPGGVVPGDPGYTAPTTPLSWAAANARMQALADKRGY